MKDLNLLTLCGSLRARSSNGAILQAYAQVAAGAGLTFAHYAGLGALPHFNPDLDHDGAALPETVTALRRAVAAADALVISTPEYVHALPGAFKNGLDWLVSDPTLPGKRVVILQAARGSTWALESLREVLRTMSMVELAAASALLPLGSNQVDADAILARADLRARLGASAAALREALGLPPVTAARSAP